MKYRMYIDEVGNSDLGASQDPNHRYLSLTSVVLELGYVDAHLFPALESLKRKYFGGLLVLVERFVLWLRRNNQVGDVMAESRGGKEDRRLKDSFERVYDSGSQFVNRQEFAARLTSRQLKVKPKSNNIAGLQLADLVAHPSYKATLARRSGEDLPQNFGGQIAAILERDKYDRDAAGQIEGWGRKWLP